MGLRERQAKQYRGTLAEMLAHHLFVFIGYRLPAASIAVRFR